METFYNRFILLFSACRGYSTPTSILSWLVPFAFCSLSGGNVWYGILAFLGVLTLHLGVNIFDDAIDYSKEIHDIKTGKKNSFNFQQGKCAYIINGDISLKASYFIAFALFFTALIIGIFFVCTIGPKLLYIIIPTTVLCLLYPILGSFGLGELIVGTIYSVFLYSGVCLVMLQNIPTSILLVSVSTGILVVNVLYNHMLLDYKIDTTNRKITLCRLWGSEKKALIFQGILIFFAYINIIILCTFKILPYLYLLTVLSLPYAITLLKVMRIHIEDSEKEIKPSLFTVPNFIINKIPEGQKSFIIKFLLSENLLIAFIILLCIAIVINKVM